MTSKKDTGSGVMGLIVLLTLPAILVTYFLYNSYIDSATIYSQNLASDDPYYMTVGYAKTVNDKITIYGKGTAKKISAAKCERGICFEIGPSVSNISKDINSLVSGSNACDNNWVVSVDTSVVFDNTASEVMKRIDGTRNAEFLTLVQNNAKVKRLEKGSLEDLVKMPVYSIKKSDLLSTVYKEDVLHTEEYKASFDAVFDSKRVDMAIQAAYDRPYEESIIRLQNEMSKNTRLFIPTAKKVVTNINGFDADGNVDKSLPGNSDTTLIANAFIKQSYQCPPKTKNL